MKNYISKLHYKKKPNVIDKTVCYFLSVISIFYELITYIRNKLYDFKILKTYKPNAFTISVGNITTGGVGKTPFALEIGKYFLSQGKKVAILSRGYGGTLHNKLPNVISDGENIFFNSQQAGDEPFWFAENLRGAIVITCSKRALAAKLAVEKFNAEILIIDDGFQHRALDRDLNLLLIDYLNRFGNEHLLPAGPLREHLSNIKRADKIIVTDKSYDTEKALKFCDEIKEKYKKEVYHCKFEPQFAYNIFGEGNLDKNEGVFAFCGIGKPYEFFNFVKEKYNLLGHYDFDDHYKYTEKDIDFLVETIKSAGIKSLITTEKDAVKIKSIVQNEKYADIKIYALLLGAVADIEKIITTKE